MTDEIKSCPFCGSNDIIVCANAVGCASCEGGVHVPHWYQGMDGEEAIAAWNRRVEPLPDPPASQSRRDEAAQGVDAGAALAWLAGQTALSLEYEWGDPDDDDAKWEIHQESGGVNDREWTRIAASGVSPVAIWAAQQALNEPPQTGEQNAPEGDPS